jgi:hypothetical protein
LHIDSQRELNEWKTQSEKKQTVGIGFWINNGTDKDPKWELDITGSAIQRSSIIERQNAALAASTCKLKAEFDAIQEGQKKTASERALLDQKTITEEAQTSDTPGVLSTVAGVIGKQKYLYESQASGFSRDAEQKAAKIAVDAWATELMANPDSASVGSGVSWQERNVLIKALHVGVTKDDKTFVGVDSTEKPTTTTTVK